MRATRRGFIAGAAAAIPFSEWVKTADAATKVFTRSEARTTQGKAMLKSYQTAVGKMKTNPDTDPDSWLFQWYTHSPPTSKTSEIARIYKTNTHFKSLAQEMWQTCQAHSATDDENFFLPWHRMFVYFFERIIRKQSGNPDFVLPYWNYSVTGQFHGVIPPEFTVAGSPLLVTNRNPGVNTGQAIDKNSPGALSLEALSKPVYQSVDPETGFCEELDSSIHGQVHVLTGTVTNMGNVPTAGQDPIFWMHHSNIDRLWASWNHNGGKNFADAAFLAKQFVFADENNNRVVATVKDFMDTVPLGYNYDRLEPKPPNFHPAALLTSAVAAAPTDTLTHVALGHAPVSLALAPVQPNTALFSARMAKVATTSQRVFLVIKDLQTNAQPGVLYNVYLDMPANATGEAREPYRVGVLNFFSAMDHDHPMLGSRKFFSFELTSALKKQSASHGLKDKPEVTIVPVAEPSGAAQPVIGTISIVQR